jgi:hypothetical protein
MGGFKVEKRTRLDASIVDGHHGNLTIRDGLAMVTRSAVDSQRRPDGSAALDLARSRSARLGVRAILAGHRNLCVGFCYVTTGYAASKFKGFFRAEVMLGYDIGAGSGHWNAWEYGGPPASGCGEGLCEGSPANISCQ